MTRPKTPLLDRVAGPVDLSAFSDAELAQLADELRAEVISAVSETGGHLGASLGVVELTVALHRIFDFKRDRLVWDVSHQAYPHKVLTGRKDRFATLRRTDGLCGRSEPMVEGGRAERPAVPREISSTEPPVATRYSFLELSRCELRTPV